MASTNGNSAAVVRYDSANSESEAAVHMHVQSPAKNRVQGRSLESVGDPGPGPGQQSRLVRRRTLVLFERASSGSFWNPKFDSSILEREVLRYYFPDTRRRFQWALVYLVVASLAWAVFFGASGVAPHWTYFLAASIALGLVALSVLLFTCSSRLYTPRAVFPTSLLLSGLLCALLLATFAFQEPEISLVGTFGGAMGILLLNYTFIPLPLYVCAPLGVLFSVAYEVLVVFRFPSMGEGALVAGKVLLHLALHLLGIHIFIIAQVRCRSSFWKMVQCAKARTELTAEKRNLDNFIHSLMPKSVADQVMTSRSDKERGDEASSNGGGNNNGYDSGHPNANNDGRRGKKRGRSKRAKGEIIFRSFNMNQMAGVSILFADIVGFTKMSSNKTAEHLVGLLNDLFGRFDELCTRAKCEKISTLGDCYYCVAGCPKPQPDHAECCVKMGLAMITAIKEFDEDNNESVNMRVGVHTGTVLCGIVGTRRFKFDVWSNDVTLANIMESSGRPGLVHISEASYEFLRDKYEVEPGEDVEDLRSFKKLIEHYDTSQSSFTIRHEQEQRVIKTYFITGVKPGTELINGPTSKSVVFSLKTPDTEEALKNSVAEKQEAGGATASANHTVQENSVNTHPVKVLSGKTSGTLPEGGDPDKLDDKDDFADSTTVPFNRTWSTDKTLRRDQEDEEMIRYLSNDKDLREFSSRLPINPLTLFFNRSSSERDYRSHYFDSQEECLLASPRWQSFIEMALSLLLFLLIASCGFVVFGRSLAFMVVFAVCLVLEVVVLLGFLADVRWGFLKRLWHGDDDDDEEEEEGVSRFISWWQAHNLVGIMMATLPAVTIYAHLDCELVRTEGLRDLFLCFCLFVSLLSFCNFSMSCSMVKSFVALLVGLALLILLNVQLCGFSGGPPPTQVALNSTPAPLAGVYTTFATTNTTLPPAPFPHLFSGENRLCFEIILNVLLILMLIWFLNREFEISYRLSFHGSAQADRDMCILQESKEQADWLLHIIIPEHVSHVVKSTHKYSKNHKDVAVIFATLVNFYEFYDEGYEGGREYLRVLNELVSDYEELLDRECFKDVEKIKTISSTFMAASGLNEASRRANRHPNAHLFALMDFSVELKEAVARFNESLLNFNFEVNIGYNYGEVTAGVIGTTKLLYDIWGDTVNIASRMYSTGVKDHIQVPESTLAKLEEMFVFEYRGEIFVKGKGDMKTYLYKSKRPDAYWD